MSDGVDMDTKDLKLHRLALMIMCKGMRSTKTRTTWIPLEVEYIAYGIAFKE